MDNTQDPMQVPNPMRGPAMAPAPSAAARFAELQEHLVRADWAGAERQAHGERWWGGQGKGVSPSLCQHRERCGGLELCYCGFFCGDVRPLSEWNVSPTSLVEE